MVNTWTKLFATPVGLDIRLALFTLQVVVLVAQTLHLGLQLADGGLQILNQVEQPDDGPFGLGYVLDQIQVKLFERHDPSLSARTRLSGLAVPGRPAVSLS